MLGKEVVLLYWGNEWPVSAELLLIIAIDLTPHSWQYAATTKNGQILLLESRLPIEIWRPPFQSSVLKKQRPFKQLLLDIYLSRLQLVCHLGFSLGSTESIVFYSTVMFLAL